MFWARGYGREVEKERGLSWRQEQGTRVKTVLLGETRQELFIVNLHIDDSFLPFTIPLQHAENKMCWELAQTLGNAAFASLHMGTYDGGDRQIEFVFMCHCVLLNC